MVLVKDTAKTMAKHRVHHPVVMKDDKVIGTLSAIDIIKVFAALD
jgi:CBS domain-containing protein